MSSSRSIPEYISNSVRNNGSGTRTNSSVLSKITDTFTKSTNGNRGSIGNSNSKPLLSSSPIAKMSNSMKNTAKKITNTMGITGSSGSTVGDTLRSAMGTMEAYKFLIFSMFLIIVIIALVIYYVLPRYFPELFQKTKNVFPFLTFYDKEKQYCPDYFIRTEDETNVVCEPAYHEIGSNVANVDNQSVSLTDHTNSSVQRSFVFSCKDGQLSYPKDVSTYPYELKRRAYQKMASDCNLEWTAVH